MSERALAFSRQIRVMLTEDLNRAAHDAAMKDSMSTSEFIRRAVLEKLRRDRRRERSDAAA